MKLPNASATPRVSRSDTAEEVNARTAPVLPDPWLHLRRHTPARIALGRTGVSLPTYEVLRLTIAHAQARDAIQVPLNTEALNDELVTHAWNDVVFLESQARDRSEYLLRPDKGRRLRPESAMRLGALRCSAPDLVLVLGDGLSSLGIQQHGVALLNAIRAALDPPLQLGPLVVVRHARVAVADEVGEILGAGMVAILIGERPGLSAPDSVGIYLTHTPRVGCSDAQRNCISNIRPAGQDFETAARRLAWLVAEGRRVGQTGITLKDHSGLTLGKL
ncbi:MAG: ethanolamine ammonia-lyase subunit EutC [Polaromonas sp.]|uniref:ethanolamine ammonia-lyase subunit EutC n=1 Tax=Polaromonas sp. TaxID=1869339 RepID=UPI0017F3F82A|nr:ethanolamine ammonia-lyase subunit EutC [Polaromonas sp.]NMM09151.1 ethanolamine ammonia-lyase subunit EutC [Polaromonas sp.]